MWSPGTSVFVEIGIDLTAESRLITVLDFFLFSNIGQINHYIEPL